ncbi:phosphatase PAP2 family protein [Permianibacter sp. IMCC34836]|uniref:phosphatase PAP2 family protein n=1 Tax=Permianibacter fluminis TaxID=2738515 RepID=UPI001556165C|nr:phosphatase PAP2 family protein [Permianibacter fluminis]NQD37777.1 phosphatase PAP2 family protein [Permianibacter fluminis]
MTNSALPRGSFSRVGAHYRALLLITMLLTGCTTLPDAARWQETAWHSANDPAVWAPLLAAVVVLPYDNDMSTKASTDTPLFGSKESAKRYSNRTQDGLIALAIASAAGCALTDETDDAGSHQAAATAFGLLGSGAASSLLKLTTNRERPDHGSHNAFPSGHASSAFASASLISATLRHCGWLDRQHWLADTLLYGSATAVSWARVEAGVHYPSDVLAGAALGNFFARWASQLWLGDDGHNSVLVRPDEHGLVLQWSYHF